MTARPTEQILCFFYVIQAHTYLIQLRTLIVGGIVNKLP